MDPQTIAAIVGVLTGIGGLVVSYRTSKSTVRKSEVEALDLTIARLQEENRRLCGRVDDLESANEVLRQELEGVKAENEDLRKRVKELEEERQQLIEELEWDNPILKGDKRD